MKKTIITSLTFALLATVVLLYSCTKEKILQPQNSPTGVSVYENENGKFKKEIVVTDESGKNSLFIAISSDDESAIDGYLKYNDLKLRIENSELIETIKQNANLNRRASKGNQQMLDVEKVRSVTIDVITDNLEESVKAYSLLVTAKKDPKVLQLQANGYIQGSTQYDYTNSSDFAGIVHWGHSSSYDGGYDIGAMGYYSTHWYSSWTQVWSYALNSSNTGNGYYSFVNAPNTYKTKISVYLDARAGKNDTNYNIAWSKDDFRGHSCAGGWFDGQNCGYGTPPSGTSAFIYGQSFYYTPVPGQSTPQTKCPLGWFDGANCNVYAIPSGAVPFVYGNSWYIKTNKILN